MKTIREDFTTLLPSLRLASTELKGSARRMFLGQLALDIGRGGRLLVSTHLGISRETLKKGIGEVKRGEGQVDKFRERGRHLLEKTHPEIVASIQEILDGSSQIDPQFTSTRLYTRLSPKVVLEELEKRGYDSSELPSKGTVSNVMKRLGYKRRKVAKTKPKKN